MGKRTTLAEGNVEALAEVLEPFTDRDVVPLFDDPAALSRFRATLEKLAGPDLVVEMVGSMVGSAQGLTGSFRGIDGFIDAWRDWVGAFSRFVNEIDDMIEVGDRVVVLTSQHGVTATGGVRLDNEGAGVFVFSDGVLTRAEFHLDRAAAMRVAGLD